MARQVFVPGGIGYDETGGRKVQIPGSVGYDETILSNHIFDYGLECTGADTAFDFNCVQGTTVLDSWTETVTVTEGAVVRSHTLPLAAAEAITDYTDVRVRGVARAP